MNQLTEPQIMEFTNDLDRIAVAIGTLRQNAKLGDGQPLTQNEQDDLLISQIKLFRSSARFSSQAGRLNADLIRTQLYALKRATTTIDFRLSRMKTVDQVLSVSALALEVATAVATGDIDSVGESLNNLLHTISD